MTDAMTYGTTSPSGLDAGVITTGTDFRTIREDWQDLHRRGGGGPFSSHAWITAWFDHFGDGAVAPRIVTLRRGGRLVAALPLGLRTAPVARSLPRLRLRHVTMLCEERVGFHEVLADPDDPEAARDLFPVCRALRLGGYADLTPMRRNPALAAATDALGAFRRSRGEIRTRIADLGQGWEAYSSGLSRKLRRNVRSAGKRIRAEEGRVRVARGTDRDGLDVLEAALDVSSQSWKARVGTDIGSEAKTRGMFRQLFMELADQGRMRVYVLEIGGRPAASNILMIEGRTAYGLVTDFVDGFAAYSPGMYLLWEAISSIAAEGVDRIDFLRDTQMTSRFATDEDTYLRLRAALAPSFAAGLAFAEDAVRSAVKPGEPKKNQVKGRRQFAVPSEDKKAQ